MGEFYADIRIVHITSALLSGGIFFLRGLAILFGSSRMRKVAMARRVRYLTFANDTVLLTAALVLMAIVRQYPGADAWLTAKVILLVAYIGLGVVAFRGAGSGALRVAAWLAALVTFAAILSVARTHNPLGFFGAL